MTLNLQDHLKTSLQSIEKLSSLTDCQRLFHGRGHTYPELSHVNVDWFSPVVLITLYQEVDEAWLNEQVTVIKQLIPNCQSIQVQYRSRKFAPSEVLWGEDITELNAQEHGLKYHISLGKAQNSGLFLDMGNGRDWVKNHSEGRNVLNLFAYTCAFSIAAIAGGARQVVNIDMSKSSLSKGRENHKLNKQDASKVKYEGVDIFKSYNRLKKNGPYDLLICDPPSFQKGSVNIERDYKKIIKRLPELMANNSDVVLCLNSPDLSEDFLLAEVARECPQCQFQHRIDNPKVFVEAEAGKGLKVLYFRYVEMC
ncbi:class I SAM-dependent methyltransferase [Colwellia sp. Bg11-12]|jgi:23S rRNA (cytosine1962-C5)-methyltransferase|uniref:class I SAM-dependent methyltransferase n=1 Tax=Colwellia sp. Bg11-12 TaxID=2759817 RepID=UPI0015F3840B|nr:class I SAM-dependent methyltransferase [Colwellia sp. Bg11-12]MBA6262581.1 class I SAM-dependent methyltransferase [Colwellia sp. Bg11-12]